MEAKNRLAVTRLTHPNMLRTLENCIRIGQPLLLEDIGEYLDPALEPVLQKAVFKQSGALRRDCTASLNCELVCYRCPHRVFRACSIAQGAC